ncbi:MAG: hypothetical protein SNJ83_14505 [Aggregatilineales bacterium]
MKRALSLTLTFCLMIALSAALGELALRIIGPRLGGPLGVAARYVTTGQPYAEAWTPAWTTNRDHYYTLRPGLVDALQYGSPTVQFRLTTNELWEGGGIGFRTRPIVFFVDAVVVGDSFGLCFTEQADCWVDLLGEALGQNIVNLSQPVTGSRSHLKILQDFGAPLRPPLVIWQFFGNDFNDDYGLALLRGEVERPPQEEAAPAEATDLRGWLRRSSVLYAMIETTLAGRYLGTPESEALFVKPYTVRFGAQNQHVMQVGGQYELQALDMSRPENQQGLAMSRAAFREAAALVESWGGRLVFVLIPTREEVYREMVEAVMPPAEIDRLASARAAMQGLCADLALTCWDAYDALRPPALNGEALYFVDDLHLNPNGNRTLAAWLAALIAGAQP